MRPVIVPLATIRGLLFDLVGVFKLRPHPVGRILAFVVRHLVPVSSIGSLNAWSFAESAVKFPGHLLEAFPAVHAQIGALRKYCASRPSVFSFVSRCPRELGSQKLLSRPASMETDFQSCVSGP